MINHLKQKLKDGKTVFGVQVRFGSAAIAELFGHAGLDFIIIDGEHGPQTPVGVQAQLQAIGCTAATPVVRLAQNDPDLIRVYLDMGAMSIFLPMISTAEQARVGADACRYPPVGTRGYGPARAGAFGFDEDYFDKCDEQMFYIANIETAKAIDNIDEILAVDGVDASIIGPCDLSISLGTAMQYDHPKLKEALKRVAQASEKAKKPTGIAMYEDISNPDSYKRFTDMGFTIFLAGGDEWMLSAAARNMMGTFKKVLDNIG